MLCFFPTFSLLWPSPSPSKRSVMFPPPSLAATFPSSHVLHCSSNFLASPLHHSLFLTCVHSTLHHSPFSPLLPSRPPLHGVGVENDASPRSRCKHSSIVIIATALRVHESILFDQWGVVICSISSWLSIILSWWLPSMTISYHVGVRWRWTFPYLQWPVPVAWCQNLGLVILNQVMYQQGSRRCPQSTAAESTAIFTNVGQRWTEIIMGRGSCFPAPNQCLFQLPD